MKLDTLIGNILFVFVIALCSNLIIAAILSEPMLGHAPVRRTILMAIFSILAGFLIHYLNGRADAKNI